MKAINDHIFAIKLAFEELGKGKFWLYLIPAVAIAVAFWFLTSFISGIFSFLDSATEVPLVGDYLGSGVKATKSFFSYIGGFFYEFVILTILSPVYCLLSEKVDNTLTKSSFDGGIGRIITDLFRAIFIVIISLILYIMVISIWWFLAWITGFHLLDQIIYFLIAAFFLGFSFYDYSLERYNIGTWKSWMFSFDNIFYMVITGGLFHLIFQIPIAGTLFAPFIISIVSTIVFLKMNQKLPLNSNISSNTDSNE